MAVNRYCHGTDDDHVGAYSFADKGVKIYEETVDKKAFAKAIGHSIGYFPCALNGIASAEFPISA